MTTREDGQQLCDSEPPLVVTATVRPASKMMPAKSSADPPSRPPPAGWPRETRARNMAIPTAEWPLVDGDATGKLRPGLHWLEAHYAGAAAALVGVPYERAIRFSMSGSEAVYPIYSGIIVSETARADVELELARKSAEELWTAALDRNAARTFVVARRSRRKDRVDRFSSFLNRANVPLLPKLYTIPQVARYLNGHTAESLTLLSDEFDEERLRKLASECCPGAASDSCCKGSLVAALVSTRGSPWARPDADVFAFSVGKNVPVHAAIMDAVMNACSDAHIRRFLGGWRFCGVQRPRFENIHVLARQVANYEGALSSALEAARANEKVKIDRYSSIVSKLNADVGARFCTYPHVASDTLGRNIPKRLRSAIAAAVDSDAPDPEEELRDFVSLALELKEAGLVDSEGNLHLTNDEADVVLSKRTGKLGLHFFDRLPEDLLTRILELLDAPQLGNLCEAAPSLRVPIYMQLHRRPNGCVVHAVCQKAGRNPLRGEPCSALAESTSCAPDSPR